MFQMYQPSDRFDWLTRICAPRGPLVSPAICLLGPFVRRGSIRSRELSVEARDIKRSISISRELTRQYHTSSDQEQ